MPIFDVLLNISTSNSHRKLCYSSSESSHRDESNEPWYVFLRPLDAEIFGETSNGAAKMPIFDVSPNISVSNGRIKLCHSSSESSHRDESNEPW
jgi:hypothetical protein